MAIHPIEYRYGTAEMKTVWGEDTKLKKMLEVEVALAKAEADLGMIPKEASEAINSGITNVSVERVKEIEDEISHDMMAVVLALSEQSKEYGEWVHFGATSNDIIDTSTALQFKDVITILEGKLMRLRSVLVDQADSHKRTVCAGRTHGQIGIPTTYGLRFAIWAEEVQRHITRLTELKPRILVGKMAGATGTQASFGDVGIELEERAMNYLGLGVAEVSNQIIQRDRHLEFVMFMANVATTLDKICIEIRTLQRTEIGEVQEFFGSKQVGSSTMPHKRNPIKSEQICGLARIIRSQVEAEFQNNTLWDERDLTNSSPERIIFPEACILTDHIVGLCTNVISNLRFYPENIEKNMLLLGGLNMAEAVMMQLAREGLGRQKSHELCRDCAMKSREDGKDFLDVLAEETEISKYISRDELEKLLDPHNYIGTAVQKVEMVVERLKGGD